MFSAGQKKIEHVEDIDLIPIQEWFDQNVSNNLQSEETWNNFFNKHHGSRVVEQCALIDLLFKNEIIENFFVPILDKSNKGSNLQPTILRVLNEVRTVGPRRSKLINKLLETPLFEQIFEIIECMGGQDLFGLLAKSEVFLFLRGMFVYVSSSTGGDVELDKARLRLYQHFDRHKHLTTAINNYFGTPTTVDPLRFINTLVVRHDIAAPFLNYMQRENLFEKFIDNFPRGWHERRYCMWIMHNLSNHTETQKVVGENLKWRGLMNNLYKKEKELCGFAALVNVSTPEEISLHYTCFNEDMQIFLEKMITKLGVILQPEGDVSEGWALFELLKPLSKLMTDKPNCRYFYASLPFLMNMERATFMAWRNVDKIAMDYCIQCNTICHQDLGSEILKEYPNIRQSSQFYHLIISFLSVKYLPRFSKRNSRIRLLPVDLIRKVFEFLSPISA